MHHFIKFHLPKINLKSQVARDQRGMKPRSRARLTSKSRLKKKKVMNQKILWTLGCSRCCHLFFDMVFENTMSPCFFEWSSEPFRSQHGHKSKPPKGKVMDADFGALACKIMWHQTCWHNWSIFSKLAVLIFLHLCLWLGPMTRSQVG